jgi:hypothetical protein
MKDEQERKDWYLLLLFLPLAILLMFFAGQKAIQLLPHWKLNADIRSNLDPNRDQSGSGTGPLAPLRPEILTPPSWNDTYLTPSADQSSATQPTFVAFNPSATASASPTPQPTDTSQATTTATTTVTVTVTATRTRRPREQPPTPVPVTSTPIGMQVAVPASVNINAPPDGSFANPQNGQYMVVDLGSDPTKWVHVTNPSDTASDLVYYERVASPSPADCPTSQCISMDSVIVGISQQPNGNPYYSVMNWGDGTPDTNTNIDTNNLVPPAVPPPAGPVPAVENDNQTIPTSALYQDPTAPGSPQTGITIDVDNAPSHPPAGDYEYVVIQAPTNPPNNGNDGADVDAVQALP